MDFNQYWTDTLRQDAAAMRPYFEPSASIRWHNTNEQFTVDEFIRANCEYPGDWDGTVEQIHSCREKTITVTRVWSVNYTVQFHVISIFHMFDSRIQAIDEYWSEDGEAPLWRQEMGIGTNIVEKPHRK